jgi:hypothetical protein
MKPLRTLLKRSFLLIAFSLSSAYFAMGSPSLTWATYFGGSGTEEVNCITFDASGNIYVCGNTASSSGIATTGAYQTTLGGATDGFLAKFSSSGALLWATYFGGSLLDNATTVAVDNSSGSVYITGYTSSTSGIATSGAYKTTYPGGSHDGFLAKFNTSGSLLWSTYYGGSYDDYFTNLALDNSGNVFVAGQANSSSGISTTGSYQTSIGGLSDAFLAKFTSSGTLLWATYYGGSGSDQSAGLATDGSGNVYLGGVTFSSSGIASSGAYKTSLSGTDDAFVAKFNSSGSRLWATYYGGSGGETPRQICADTSGNVYLTGYTSSTSGIATSGAYMTSYGGGTNDAYLAKFTSSGSLSWATYFGATGDDEGYAIATNSSQEVFMAGYTASSSGIATSGTYQSIFGGGSTDAMLVKFNSSGSLAWATYFGGSGGAEGILALAADNAYNIYFGGRTASTSSIATSGAYQTTYGGGTIDAFLGVFQDTSHSIAPPSYRPVITSTTPANNATGVNPANPLTVTFNRNISKGTSGNIYIKNQDLGTTITKAVTSSDVTITGKTVTISGLSLANNTNYHVTFDSVCFDTASYNSYGLYDTTAWKFKTAPAVVKKKGKKGVELSVVDPTASNQLNIMATLEEPGNYDLMVYDLTGRIIYNKNIELHSGDQKISLNDLQLSKSMYILRISNGTAYDAIKFIVQ